MVFTISVYSVERKDKKMASVSKFNVVKIQNSINKALAYALSCRKSNLGEITLIKSIKKVAKTKDVATVTIMLVFIFSFLFSEFDKK